MWSVYKLVLENNEVYFGITQNLKKRLSEHRTCKGESNHPYVSYQIVLTDLDEETARMTEDELIMSLPCINRYRSGNRTKQEGYDREYYEANKERMNLNSRNWHSEHREEHNEVMRAYRYEHHEKRLESDRKKADEERALCKANNIRVTEFRKLPKEERDRLRALFRE